MKKQTLFALFAAIVLLLGMNACVEKIDNPLPPTAEVDDDILDFPELEIDPNEFQPTDISVALLGSLDNYAEEEATRSGLRMYMDR